MPTQPSTTRPVPVSPPTTNQRIAPPTSDRPNTPIRLLVDDTDTDERIGDLHQRVLALEAGTAPTRPAGSGRPTVPPPQVTQALTATGSGVQFTFAQVNVTNLTIDGYHIYRSADIFPNAHPIAYVKQSPSHPSIIISDTIAAGSVFYYWVTAVDTTGTESSPAAAQAVPVTSGSVVASNGSVSVNGVTAVDGNGNLILKNANNAFGTTGGPTTTSTSYSTVPEMVITITTSGNKVFLSFAGNFSHSTGGSILLAFFRGSTQVSKDLIFDPPGAGIVNGVSLTLIDTGALAGSNSFSLQWKVVGGTATAFTTLRQMQAIELG